MTEITFGLDPGTRAAGLAILYSTDHVLTRIETVDLTASLLMRQEFHHDQPVASLDYKVRVNRIITRLHDQLKITTPNVLGIETPFISMGSASAFVPLYYFRMKFEEMMAAHFPAVVIVDKSPMSVKKHMGVSNKKSQRSKDPMREAIQLHPVVGQLLPVEINKLTEHEVDAIAIALTTLEVPNVI